MQYRERRLCWPTLTVKSWHGGGKWIFYWRGTLMWHFFWRGVLMWHFCWCGILMWSFFADVAHLCGTFSGVARLCGVSRQKKNHFPPPRQLLTVNVGQHKRRSLYCTNIYSSVPKLSPEILVTPMCSWRNSLDPFLHLYPLNNYINNIMRGIRVFSYLNFISLKWKYYICT